MAEIIRMPRLSDTMEEGNIVAWLKHVGDPVEPGDVLAEVETDKATMELESFFSGHLLYIGVAEGPVAVDGIIAIIGEKNEDFKAALEAAEKETPKHEESSSGNNVSESSTSQVVENKPVSQPMASASNQNIEISHDAGRIFASPLAKSMAKEAGIDLSTINGTGEGGRIIKKDIENYKPVSSTAGTSISAPIGLDNDIQYGDMPISQMRKVIARRLGESKFSAPHFYLTIEVDMDMAISSRKLINESSETRISFNDFVVKACASALRKHPMINASWLGDKITIHEDINIGVAVAVPDGLLVPVIRHADRKPLSYINTEVKELAKKAKAKKLQPEEMQGNTFTISNLGMFDIDEFTAIINPPDACILAVGGIAQKPVVKNNEIVVGNVMKVTLSCDHRIVDGVTGAQFLSTFKKMMENPVHMLV